MKHISCHYRSVVHYFSESRLLAQLETINPAPDGNAAEEAREGKEKSFDPTKEATRALGRADDFVQKSSAKIEQLKLYEQTAGIVNTPENQEQMKLRSYAKALQNFIPLTSLDTREHANSVPKGIYVTGEYADFLMKNLDHGLRNLMQPLDDGGYLIPTQNVENFHDRFSLAQPKYVDETAPALSRELLANTRNTVRELENLAKGKPTLKELQRAIQNVSSLIGKVLRASNFIEKTETDQVFNAVEALTGTNIQLVDGKTVMMFASADEIGLAEQRVAGGPWTLMWRQNPPRF